MDGVIVNFSKGYVERANQKEPGFLDNIGFNGDFKELDALMQKYFAMNAPNEKEKDKAKYRGDAKFWSFIKGDVQWWENLEWMPDGKELFNNLYTLRQNGLISELSILSAPSKSDPIVPEGKRKWIAKHNLTNKLDRQIFENDKYKYVESNNDILIDDTFKKLDDWQNAGGTPILHTSTAKTLSELNKILLKDRA